MIRASIIKASERLCLLKPSQHHSYITIAAPLIGAIDRDILPDSKAVASKVGVLITVIAKTNAEIASEMIEWFLCYALERAEV